MLASQSNVAIGAITILGCLLVILFIDMVLDVWCILLEYLHPGLPERHIVGITGAR